MPGRVQVALSIMTRPISQPVWSIIHSLTRIKILSNTHYLDLSMFGARFRAPIDKLSARLPSKVLSPIETSPGIGELMILANDFRRIDLLSPYRELAIAIPVLYHNETTTESFPALWYLYLPVTSKKALWGGVKNFGFPKFIADIKMTNTDRESSCILVEKGSEILTVNVKKSDTAKSEWKLENITKLDGNLIKSTLLLEGQRCIRNISGGASLSLGKHRIANELFEMGIELQSSSIEYVPQAQAILKNTREVLKTM